MKALVATLVILTALSTGTKPAWAETTLWPVQAIDTMKISRDRARDPHAYSLVPGLTKAVADLGATHIALGTPYDDEFYSYLKSWVTQARKQHLKVWFRGNFSGWEDWFSYGRTLTPTQHHQKTADFITLHPDLFADGDIFTPAPEPENGAIGDPRQSSDQAAAFNQFLIDSYETCTRSFAKIGTNVTCGYFSTNGDVAKQILTKATVAKIGGVVVIDHYIKDPVQMTTDINYLAEKLGSRVVVGEFGAPIADLNGTMNETQQATFNRKLLHSIYASGTHVVGVNYWTLIDGSTALLNPNQSIRETTFPISDYFRPGSVSGRVLTTENLPLSGATISWDTQQTSTDRQGNYRLNLPAGEYELTFTATNYKPFTKVLILSAHEQKPFTVNLELKTTDWWSNLTAFVGKLVTFHF